MLYRFLILDKFNYENKTTFGQLAEIQSTNLENKSLAIIIFIRENTFFPEYCEIVLTYIHET